MKLDLVLEGVKFKLLKGSLDTVIKDIIYDSRQVIKNSAFICLKGIDTDGHKYINEAIKKGANTIILEDEIDIKEDVTVIKLDNTRESLGYLSSNFFNHPEDKLIKIGITGTKGKTTISWMLKKVLESQNEKVGVIGTIGTYINNKKYANKNTTPESYELEKYMSIMVKEKVKYLIMEVSSIALKVGRVNTIFFDYAIFTNLSIDHVGPREHPSYEDYTLSKAKLFKKTKVGILNIDDDAYKQMIKDTTCEIITYGKNKDANIQISDIIAINQKEFLGTRFNLSGAIKGTYEVSSPGDFSAYNTTSVIILLHILNIDLENVEYVLKNFSVPGRCEIFNIRNGKVIIDFAHNKLSFESILTAMKDYPHNRIITVFGCGGGRNYDRHFELGEASGKFADLSIISTDNPEYDDLDVICNDIKDGVLSVGGNYKIIKDRKEAIDYAISIMEDNDLILLLGKGAEDYQTINGKTTHFSEKEIINNYR